jgi:hypothetical protein
VWFENEEDELFITYPEMHLFLRDGSNVLEGTEALAVNQITSTQFDGGVDPEALRKLIESISI